MKKLIILIACLAILNGEESDYEKKARNALQKITTEQIENIKKQANSTNSGNEKNIKGFVLSSNIRDFKDISKNINRNINQIKRNIRSLIKAIALDIEINKGSSGSLSLDKDGNIKYKPSKNLPEKLDTKRKILLESNLDNSVSIKSASLAFQLLVSINDDLKQQARKATNRKTKENFYMTQAIYIYEMADILLELLDGLALDGKNSILTLYQDAKLRVNTSISNIEKQKEKAKKLKEKKLISTQALKQELSDLDLIKKANERSLDTWKSIINKIGNQENFLNKLKAQKDLIIYKRDKAKLQIETLRDLASVAELKDSIGSLDDIVASVAKLDLLILDEKTVSSLLGYDHE
jgi:hypothetical protein